MFVRYVCGVDRVVYLLVSAVVKSVFKNEIRRVVVFVDRTGEGESDHLVALEVLTNGNVPCHLVNQNVSLWAVNSLGVCVRMTILCVCELYHLET